MSNNEKGKKRKTEITGEISIHTENIFPIIKKWLYSEHEIFLRELVSNGFDAITKLQQIATREKVENVAPPKINIQIDAEKKTIIFSDTGLGLDVREVEKYITQIAFSSAEEFVKKFEGKDEKNQIIGHFGLGFYSSFMVSDLVEIRSKSYKQGSKPILWSCDGSTKYTIKVSNRKEIGTDVILHISEESKEFLDVERIKGLVKKYMNFLPVEIQVNGEKVNDDSPLWVQAPNETKDEDYKTFYNKMYPFSAEPLFWIHLNVDYPFNLKGILYFPKVMHELDANKNAVKLYCKQVFVSDDAKDVMPEFLTLLQGAIDCPEIPLNVSRSYLQNDPYVRKISKHIIKKVADKLNQLYKKDRSHFESIWADISPFIKYGMMQNDDFYSKVKDIIIFESSKGEKTSIPDYLARNDAKMKDKVLYCTDKEGQATYVSLCKEQGLEVLFLQGLIDTHFVQFLESKDEKVKYVSIDSEVSDLLVNEAEKTEVIDEDNKTADDRLVEIFKQELNDDKLKIEVKSLKSESIPCMILEAEYVKRIKSMSYFMKGGSAPTFDDFTLVINSNSGLVKDILALNEGGSKKNLVSRLCHHVFDLAKMSKQQLSGEQMQAFVTRSTELMAALSQLNLGRRK